MPIIEEKPAESYHLEAGSITYDFHPQAGAVAIVVTRGIHRDTYCLQIGEARDLYTRLLKSGYRKF